MNFYSQSDSSDINEIIIQAINQLQILAKRAEVSITLNLEDNLPKVKGSSSVLSQICISIIINAI